MVAFFVQDPDFNFFFLILRYFDTLWRLNSSLTLSHIVIIVAHCAASLCTSCRLVGVDLTAK